MENNLILQSPAQPGHELAAAASPRHGNTLLLAFGAAVAVSLGSAQGAFARGDVPVLLQITNITAGAVSTPNIRSQDGDSLVFTSSGNVVGTSPGHNEVYFYDVSTRVTTRLTTTTVGESREGARETDTIGAGGRPEQVTFISSGNLDPSVGNVDGNPEVFIWRRETNTIHQLTNTSAGVVNQEPYASDSGKCIVFSSTGDLDNNVGQDSGVPPTNYTNADGSLEVFMYSVNSATNFPYDGFFTQASNGPFGTNSTEAVVGGYIFQRQCQTTAYVSDFDQTNEGFSGHNIYLFDRNTALTQVIESSELAWDIQPGEYLHPAISSASPFARGPFIVFQTDADEWRNGSDGFEMFRFRVNHPRLTQYTDYLDGSVERPVISDGGGYITFQSTSEVLDAFHRAHFGGDPPFNADGNYEIFRTKGRTKAWQITNSSGCTNDEPSARDDGTALTFRSDCDLIPGRNSLHMQQVFLYREVYASDPLATSAGCMVANGCCNEANGCYHPIYGRKPSTRGKGCLDSPRGCEELNQ